MKPPIPVFLALLALTLAALSPSPAVAAPLAAGKSKFLGSAYSTSQATGFLTYFNQVTPENAGKWGSVEATRDVMNWTDLDAAYSFAKTNGLVFRFHILVWGSQQPSWIDALTTAEKLEEIKEWYAAVAARYPDIDYLEVVNEPLHAPPNGETIAFSTTKAANYADALGGSGASGWEWILRSFRLARQYFPGKKLVLNEYGLLNDATQMGRYVQIINLLKAENLVDVVATQAHSFEIKDAATATLTANLTTLAATGLPIMITEMDIDDTTAKPQLADYQRIFPLFWEHPSVVGITLWGFRPGLWRDQYGAALLNADGSEKPAMAWLKGYLANNLPVVTAGQSFTVPGGITNQTLLGIVQATDADAGTTLRDWAITGGTAATAVAIDAITGALRVTNVAALNFSTQSSYTVSVTVSDGVGRSAAGTVTLTAAPAPVLVNDLSSLTIFAGTPWTLNAYAYGNPFYSWLYSADGVNFIPLGGAGPLSRNAFYRIENTTPANSGYYRVLVVNDAGGMTWGQIVRIDFVPLAVAAVRADGYAASTTGGGTDAASQITVTTAAEFRAAATATEARVITVSGTLDIGTLEVTSNKTIQGARFDSSLLGTLRIGAGVTNVVVRGLNLSSPAGDALVVAGGSRVFVNRCTFLDAAGHQLAITDGADQVTVSMCEFTFASNAAAERRSVLVGKAGSETKPLRVTMHHNHWHGPVGSDMPLATYAHLHLYSNVFAATGNSGGTVVGNQTQLLNERNYYTGMKDPLVKNQGALVRTVATDYAQCTGLAPDAGTDSVFVPNYGYVLAAMSRAGNVSGSTFAEAMGPSASISGPSAAVVPATTLTLRAAVTNGVATAYQWRRGGALLPGATSATYSATMSATEAGIYTVEATLIEGGMVVSAPATVTLGTTPPPPPPPPSNGGGSSGGGGGGSLGIGLCGVLAALGALARMRR
jgi:endo-1,4-beta-xylanase